MSARSALCCCSSNFSCGVCLSDLADRNAADRSYYPQAWFPGPHPSPAAVELSELRRRRVLGNEP
jgi:hypothetical protein